MPSNANQNYTKQIKFWSSKNRPALVGDTLGREPAIKLVKPKTGDLIWEAGSGTGYMAREYAKRGARVIGTEINKKMLEASKVINLKEQLPILYLPGDIVKDQCGENLFDTVSCVAVIFHLTRDEVNTFFKHAYQSLKSGGKLVISYTSKKLMDSKEGKDLGWVRFTKRIAVDKTSILRTEYYRNADGDIFSANVWGHESQDLIKMLKNVGFKTIKHQEQLVTKKSLVKANATGETGFVAFEQISCIKP